MTKAELIEAIKAKKEKEVVAEEVTNAEQTVENIETKVVDDVKAAEGMPHEELPTQKDVEKEVAAAVDPVVDADKDGISKNGGEEELSDEHIEAEKEKEDKHMKDVINVTGRTYEESIAVEKELKAQLESSANEIASLKEQISKINSVAKAALEVQAERYTEAVSERVSNLLNQIRAEGLKIEESLMKEAEAAKKNCAKAESFAKNSLKLNKILREGLIAGKAEKKMVVHESARLKTLKLIK